MWEILNKKKKYDDVSYLEGFPIYFILALWAFICLFPIYWVFITSFKEAYVVNDGPFYIFQGFGRKRQMAGLEHGEKNISPNNCCRIFHKRL